MDRIGWIGVIRRLGVIGRIGRLTSFILCCKLLRMLHGFFNHVDLISKTKFITNYSQIPTDLQPNALLSHIYVLEVT